MDESAAACEEGVCSSSVVETDRAVEDGREMDTRLFSFLGGCALMESMRGRFAGQSVQVQRNGSTQCRKELASSREEAMKEENRLWRHPRRARRGELALVSACSGMQGHDRAPSPVQS